MGKNTLHLRGDKAAREEFYASSLKGAHIPEHAVRAAPENAARALTPAEQEARRHLRAIAQAEDTAQAELAARAKP